jgi:hypothetical protein
MSLAGITERLMIEFGDRIQVSTISEIVLECRHDLQGSPVLALPELVERLARQRLLEISSDREPPGAAPACGP